MTKQKKLDLGQIAGRELRKQSFAYMSGSRVPATAENLREVLESSLHSQLPGETYVYVIRPECMKYKRRNHPVYHIDKYFK